MFLHIGTLVFDTQVQYAQCRFVCFQEGGIVHGYRYLGLTVFVQLVGRDLCIAVVMQTVIDFEFAAMDTHFFVLDGHLIVVVVVVLMRRDAERIISRSEDGRSE